MGERVEVDLASLGTFATSVDGLASGHSSNADKHSQDLLARTGEMYAAGDAFYEAKAFALYHSRLAYSAGSMLTDTIAGLESLGSGARYCAANYAASDERNAEAQRRQSGDAETVPDSPVDEAFGSTQKNEYVPPGNSPEEVLARKEAINNARMQVTPPDVAGQGG
ncbi:hypothetical protein [Kineosporia succinea]|uniref:Excreted virulence factor EspC (Type VII ESX diderm) n=1 Tax=Kineosporia succinea TaxID=84632 RepID=A0ABT9P4L5_9ACTN|nr:hypothetical protein [Kineosporia succinea]MDP9827491.1 hypothetical protein [Kineosporia succinea]